MLWTALYRATLAVGLLAAFLVSDSHAARKLYVVVAADTQDEQIGKFAEADQNMVNNLFATNVLDAELQLVPIAPNSLTRNGVAQAIQQLPMTAEDAVVFYFSGHGAFAKDGRHYMVTRGGQEWISRDSIIQSLRNRGGGLTVVLTDACANFSSVDPDQTQKQALAHMLNATTPLFKKLFFQANGFIDISSCKRDQVSLTNPDHTQGSVFTAAFVQQCKMYKDSEIGWSDLLVSVTKDTADRFQELCGDGQTVAKSDGTEYVQTTQTVTRNALEIQPYHPGDGSGAEPPPNDKQEYEYHDFQIDPKTGRVYAIVIHVTYDPNTGKAQIHEEPPSFVAQAELVYGSDGTPYYRHTVFGGTTYYVKAELPSSPDKPNGNGKTFSSQRLGILAGEQKGMVVVLKTVPNGPAQKCFDKQGKNWKLEPGDFITHINGQPVGTLAGFVEAVQNSPKRMSFRATDGMKSIALLVDLKGDDTGDDFPNPHPAPPKGVQFGVRVQAAAVGGGVEVIQVLSGSPATKMRDAQGITFRLESGDVILRVNGKAVNSDPELGAALDASPRKMRIEVRDPSGTIGKFVVTLNK